MKRLFYFLGFLSTLYILCSCNSNYTIGKKKGFFKIDFPEKKYQLFDQPGYPYTFEYPAYATIIKDTVFFEDKPENPWWINIDIPHFAGRIYISYKSMVGKNLDSLRNDAFKMAFKQHAEVSTGIEDSMMITPNGAKGLYYSLKGNTATANQFYLTDETKHFLRGSLYFDATPNEDSLRIVNDFLKIDLQHLINTLKWR